MKTNCCLRIFLFLVFYISDYFSFGQVNLSQGLIAYYPFNGNANDVSGSNINGVVTNATLTTDRFGIANSAYYFNGATSYIQLPYSNLFDFNPQDSFSISIWVLPDQGYSWPAQAVVVKSPPHPDYLLSNWNYGVYVLNYKAMSGYANQNFLVGNTVFTSTQCWYNIIVTYKDGIWKLYVNGSLEASDFSQTHFILRDGTSKIVFGKKGESFGDWYKGKMDEVRIYNRVLNQDEVNAISGNSSGIPMDFGFFQNTCSPKKVQFGSNLPNAQSFEWEFGDGQTNTVSQTPINIYSSYGNYNVKLKLRYSSGCYDSVSKTITVNMGYDNTLIQNSDTTICLGDSVLLRTPYNTQSLCFQPPMPGIPLTSYVKPTATTVYKANTLIGEINLATNGDFTAGNTGFSSDYSFASSNAATGQYWIGSNPVSWNSGLSACHDHTTGTGNMLMIKTSSAPKAKIWSTKVNVTPNTDYMFSTWLNYLTTVTPSNTLHFEINGVQVLAYNNTFSIPSSSCSWNWSTTSWNSGTNTTATIDIINDGTNFSGSYFALDDIFFGPIVAKTDSVKINVGGLCDSIKITGADKICSLSDTLTYSIYKSPDCTQQYSMQVDNAFASIVSQTPTSLKLLFKKNGTTTIKAAYTNNCKIVVDSLNVSIKLSPTSINFGPNVVICRDTSLVLNAGNGFVSYTWQDGSHDSTFIINTPGNYNVIAQNFCGGQLKDTFKLIKTFAIPFEVSPLTATACTGDSIQFKANGGSSYFWSPASNFNNPSSGTTKALINATQNFTVLISDPTCKGDTIFIIPVTASPGANISVEKSNDANCSNDSAILIASGGVSYTWSPNLYITRNGGSQVTVKPYQTTTYIVQGRNQIGCYGQDSVTVYFFKTGDQKLFMPTAFTPNSDGKNDLFRPTFIGPSAKYDFKIYNRWGQLVYASKLPGAGWDGTLNGIPQKGDVYVFYITAEGGCNGKFEQKGTFVLIR
jgi:gliding motility-associated-like protein